MLRRVNHRYVSLALALMLATAGIASPVIRAQQNQSAEQLLAEANRLRAIGTKKAIEQAISRLLEVARFYQTAGDQARQAAALSNVARSYLMLGEFEKSLDYYQQALELCRGSRDLRREAITTNDIGAVYDSMGDKQRALDYFNQALVLYRKSHDTRNEASTLNNMGLLYKRLGDDERALDYLTQALPLTQEANDSAAQAGVLNGIASIYKNKDETEKALEYLNQALPLCEAVKNARCEGGTLNSIANVYGALGDQQKALSYYGRALPFLRAARYTTPIAVALNGMGLAYSRLGDLQKALDYYHQTLAFCRAAKELTGEASALFNIAFLERDRGNLGEALTNIEASINIIESLRARISSQEFRSSYFATVQNYYELYIDLLMRLHSQQPTAGYLARALVASERSRARSLLETLNEANADIREGVDPALLQRERTLQLQLNARAAEQLGLLSRPHTDEQATEIDKDVEDLTTALRQTEAEIRLKSPGFAALTQPQPLSLQAIQSLLDRDTILLEYSLGSERSYLWLVTPTAIKSYLLPKRQEVEEVARQLYQSITSRQNFLGLPEQSRRTALADLDAKTQKFGVALSQVVLGPVAQDLGSNRLIIVADGALQYVSFAGLPISTKEGTATRPMILEHEIVTLPSASTLAVLRRDETNRKPPDKSIAVLADPVFDAQDERLLQIQKDVAVGVSTNAKARGLSIGLETAANDSGFRGLRIPRLEGTRDEANRILALVPTSQSRAALGFAASRETAKREDIAQYRYLHFATHGLMDSFHPELSGILLSTFDEKGNPQDGFLRAHEIYNLKLSAELVVLSACQTGLGKEVRGEGLISLTRGFMYAGVPRVVVSLWSVSDQATAELMARFYQGMIKENLRPPAALRAAQISLLNEKRSRWDSPFYWAAFTLQGEWR